MQFIISKFMEFARNKKQRESGSFLYIILCPYSHYYDKMKSTADSFYFPKLEIVELNETQQQMNEKSKFSRVLIYFQH